MKRLPKAYSREKRKQQVIRQFCVWMDNGDTEPKTMYRIAKALAMTPQKHVSEILLEMVLEGKLKVEERDQSGRWTTRFYSLSQPREHYHEKLGKRRMVVKRRGEVIGNLEVPSGQMGLWS